MAGAQDQSFVQVSSDNLEPNGQSGSQRAIHRWFYCRAMSMMDARRSCQMVL
jgi:hypothetical protein